MKARILALSALVLAGCQPADKAPDLKNEKDRVSYMIGHDIGKNMKDSEIDVNPQVLSFAIKEALSGAKPVMTEEQLKETAQNFRKEMMAKQQQLMQKRMADMKAQGEKNKTAGEAFLAENKKKPGIQVSKSGLQYQVVQDGKGPLPKDNDTVVVKYRGTLIDGTEFDNSENHGGTATFPVNAVIPGWSEALKMMKVGSKWKVFIPSELAYGPNPAGPKIQPNSTLIFDVELVNIEKPTAAPQPMRVAPPAPTSKSKQPAKR